MALDAYRAKRDFRKTPEPRGAKAARRARRGTFVVQKHLARQLHYDFRLELDGVLVSWAVPKGPSLDPADKRLAMHVEDHPLEYAGFEGVIPKGEYGGGTVMVWDKGSWTPRGDPVAGYRSGHLTFTLHGEKLRGNWALIRTRNGRYAGKGGHEPWLLIKESDEFAKSGNGSIVETAAESVVSGRSIEQIAQARERVWRSKHSVAANVRAGAVAPPSNAVARPSASEAASKTRVRSARGKPATEAPATGAAIAGVALTNPDKLYFPEAGLTKRDLAL